MDWRQFFAAVIGHLAWPAVAATLLVMCRRQISSLAERLSELSYGGAKVTFERSLTLGAALIEKAPEKAAVISDDLSSSRRADAVDRVISCYEQVNGILFAIAHKAGFDVAEPRSVMYSLVKKGIVSSQINDLYGTIRDARNIVVHAGVLPSEPQANEYARQAAYLLEVLRTVEDKFNRGEASF